MKAYTKEDITRDCLDKNIMKQVIIRIDYQGITDMKSFQAQASKFLPDFFKGFEKKYSNKMDITLPNVEEISSSLSIPISEIEKEPIYVYKESIWNDNVTLNLSEFSTDINILCENYTSIDDYIDFFVQFIDFLEKENPYFVPKRLGLRKISWKVFLDYESAFNVFEKSVFYNVPHGFAMIGNNLYDLLESSNKFFINYRREIKNGKARDSKGNESPAYRFMLDFDCYLDENKIKALSLKTPDKFSTNLRKMNDDLFELFKSSVTVDFLNANRKEKL